VDHRPIVILTALEMEAKALTDVKGVDELHVIGMGARWMPCVGPAGTVILAGLGGALDPNLRVGDLVLDTPINGLPLRTAWHIGAIHTANQPVTTPAKKAALFRETEALVVDMEQATVRRTLPQGVRLIGLRAISDPAEMLIDPAVLGFIDPNGRPRPRALAAALLRRPGLIRHLRMLRSNSRVALHNLGVGAAALVGAVAADHSAGSS
jgi:adenosylhomocysteine nucleosidase